MLIFLPLASVPVALTVRFLPSGQMPSTVTFTLSPAAAITTVVFFPAPGLILDLASFSFQVPMFTSEAEHTVMAANSTVKLSKSVLVFMRSPLTDFVLYLETKISDLDLCTANRTLLPPSAQHFCHRHTRPGILPAKKDQQLHHDC